MLIVKIDSIFNAIAIRLRSMIVTTFIICMDYNGMPSTQLLIAIYYVFAYYFILLRFFMLIRFGCTAKLLFILLMALFDKKYEKDDDEDRKVTWSKKIFSPLPGFELRLPDPEPVDLLMWNWLDILIFGILQGHLWICFFIQFPMSKYFFEKS